jgi:predicted metal-dependent phosphotriesterase family hydrolase
MTGGQDARSTRFSRREIMRLLGIGAGLGVATEVGRTTDLFAGAVQRAGGTLRLRGVPSGAVIRTAVKDIDPNDIIGSTLMHEHLGNGRPGRGGGPPVTPSQDPDWMAEELVAARNAGLGCIVAASTSIPPPETLTYLRLLSERTGLHIIPAGAYYGLTSYPADIKTQSESEVADGLVKAAAAGRFGAFGEMGVANDEADMAPEEKKVFRAVGKASARTGIPIFTHNNYSTGPKVPMDMALRQLDQLEAGGAKPQSVALGHVCCLDDPGAMVAKQLAKRGAFVAFDRVTRQQQWVTDEHRAVMIRSMVDAGYVDHVLIASDNTGSINTAVGEVKFYPGPLHAREGGPGYARPLILFVPILLKAGLAAETVRKLTQDNPRRFLAFVPKNA